MPVVEAGQREDVIGTMASKDDELDALGQIARSDGRTAVVQYVRRHPGAYFSVIQEATGIPVGSLGKHLRDLETAGVVTGDLPPDVRAGRTVRYTVDDGRLRALLRKLELALLGEGDEGVVRSER